MARKTLSILFRQYLFWMLFFAFGRLLFMLYHFRELKGIPFSEYAFTFIKAIFLDNSTTCYFLSFSFLFLLVHQFLRNRLFAHINRVYSYVLIIIVSIIVSAEFELYSEWGSKLNYKALTYLENPSEIFRSAGVFKFSIGILLIVLQIITGCYLYQKLVHKHYVEVEKNWKFSVLYFVFFPPLIFAGIRGGLFQAIPINQSDVYFSKHNFLNIAAVNSVWNLGHSIEHNKKYLNKNPYLYYTIDEAKENIKPLFEYTNDSVAKVLNTEKPNIVLIILESWSADLIKSLGGFDSITPQFAELEKKGILFTDFYASGMRSEQGMSAIFSAFPCPPSTSILKQPDKFQKLNCIGTIFKNAGYKTSFLFGGQLNYGNIKGYMYYNKFDRINEGEDFPADIPRGWLGVPDEYLFKRHIDDMKNEPEPFFSSVFTLSTHSPYDQPMKDVFDWGENEKGYINSAYYTDKCLGNYFKEAEKQHWYKNTLFIIVADHSHNSPRNWHIFSPKYRKIPLLLYGEVIKEEYRGVKWSKLGSQVDLAATVLSQLNMDYSAFKWSKNLFHSGVAEYAYYEVGDGLGWVTPHNRFVYHKGLNNYYEEKYENEEKKQETLKQGKSYLQVLFQEYLDF